MKEGKSNLSGNNFPRANDVIYYRKLCSLTVLAEMLLQTITGCVIRMQVDMGNKHKTKK
jgi:hypothetical protein